MYSLCLRIGLIWGAAALGTTAEMQSLRVCADPNNLPFSNQAGEGFENKIVALVAQELNAKVDYTWWAGRKSSLKDSLGAGLCDLVMGVPAAVDSVLVTRPYYRSTYVFASRKDRGLRISSLNDPRLAKWRIGMHVVGGGYTPPAQALAKYGVCENLVPFSLLGGYGETNPPAKIMEAVSRGEIDVAIVWGPLAGYFGRTEANAIDITSVSPSSYSGVPFIYSISAAVRKGDDALLAAVDGALTRRCTAIRSILDEYGVPDAPEGNPPCDGR